MRVISGKYRRIALDTVAGDKTRPTTDRIKETLFNIIANDVMDCSFLDLFAGSGQIGIEALSRGADHVTFVEKNPKAVRCIKSNLKKIKAKEDFEVVLADVFGWLNHAGKYDIIFIDPPYALENQKELIELIESKNLLNEDGYIILEAKIDNNADFNTAYTEVFRVKEYKTNKHLFLRKKL